MALPVGSARQRGSAFSRVRDRSVHFMDFADEAIHAMLRYRHVLHYLFHAPTVWRGLETGLCSERPVTAL